jgi:high affinity choline transporter 7
MFGGLWSVAWTDALQLVLVVVGLLVALPYVFGAVGVVAGASAVTSRRGLSAADCFRRCNLPVSSGRCRHSSAWWDVSLMLMLGGIPWNCYFQRVSGLPDTASCSLAFDSGRAG